MTVFCFAGLLVFIERDNAMNILFLLSPFVVEIVQPFIGRVFSWSDIFHDFLGIIMAYCMVRLWDEIYPIRAAIRGKVKRDN